MSQESNIQLITKFYEAFQNRDAETMASCYHEDITFEDPVFGELKEQHASNMWRMLLKQGDSELKIRYSNVNASDSVGSCNWEADYHFSKTGRLVKNRIKANFKFKDGLIIDHRDSFSMWKWAQMALGPVGLLLGFTPIIKNKVRAQALKALSQFESQF
ncbi:nuclear transport factor 2 family protein [Fulvivirga lutea]|uniref:Nuclear transport factor 2 family protein n=1 Tax=Fulvivirga lutea TaxID=2810512 RepID=A0A974WGF1_9BACT|nr:nuclear transport factor 2 family protein [Fulvivirga lutea]QSE96602.1 nuclear transport factor 2 family protein [Fulvivirga lutea]